MVGCPGSRDSRRPCALAGALVLLLAASGSARAVSPSKSARSAPRTDHSVVLKVLTYNIRGLPLIADLDRLGRIGEILAERRRRGEEPDVVVLQEAFVEESRRVRSRAGYPYVVDGRRDGRFLIANGSGLEILSNHPILDRYGRSFDDCAFPECLVSKSIFGVTLQHPELPEPLRVFTTHLQADSRNESVRRNQIDDIAVFLSRIGFGRELAVFAGDFNFKPRHASYHKFLRELPVVDAGAACLAAPGACRVVVGDGGTERNDVWKTTHDRQFFYLPPGSELRIEPARVVRNFTERFEGGSLSDHWGYEVHYRIRW